MPVHDDKRPYLFSVPAGHNHTGNAADRMEPELSKHVEGPGAPDRGDTCLTVRGVAIALVLCVLIGLAGPYWCFLLGSSRMFVDYHAGGQVFTLVVLLALFNAALACVWRRFRLLGRELRLITAMTLCSGAVCTAGLVAYLIPGMTGAFYYATAANKMEKTLWPLLNRRLFPLDGDGGIVAIEKFWSGIPKAEPIPWGPWVGPLILWGIFLIALFACMMALMALMRKQWMDHEHLSFPIAQVPAELCRAAEQPGSASSILRSRPFWIGVGIAFLLASSGGLNHHFGGFPNFRIRHDIVGVWAMPLRINVDLVILGLVFLIPNRITFSIWSLSLLSWGTRVFIRTYSFQLRDWMPYGVVGHPELQHVAMGSMIALTAGSLWLGRHHLGRALRCALGREPGYDRGEPCTYRTAFVTIAACLAVVMIGFRYAGLDFRYAGVLVLVTLIIHYSIARVTAQCGLPTFNTPAVPSTYVVAIVGSRALGPQQTAVMGMHLAWHGDLRGSAFSASGHGMYLTGRRSRGTFWAMLGALALTYAVASAFTVYLGYRHGASNMPSWFIQNPTRITWQWANGMVAEPRGPSQAGIILTAVGAVVMAGLMLAQRTFFWWPIHPVGFLTSGSYIVTAFWFTIFLAWLTKLLVVRFGGHKTYAGARKFFIGIVLGYFIAGGLWAVLDTLLGTTGNQVFAI